MGKHSRYVTDETPLRHACDGSVIEPEPETVVTDVVVAITPYVRVRWDHGHVTVRPESQLARITAALARPILVAVGTVDGDMCSDGAEWLIPGTREHAHAVLGRLPGAYVTDVPDELEGVPE